MFPPVDTTDSAAATAFVRREFAALFPAASFAWLEQVFADVVALFAGQHPSYGAIDLRYHDLEHTLQTTVCLTQLLSGYQRSSAAPGLSVRQFELGLVAALLHDTGYLKLRADTGGTGAKYTYCHVLRSCAFAASYLPTRGVSKTEIDGMLGAISCTGPTKRIANLHFRDATERFVGCAVATADYLGQMAAPDYPDELAILYAEFAEADDFLRVPVEQRVFHSAADLIARTPAFWTDVVRPKLEHDLGGAYRYLATPPPDGPNPYLDAVARNLTLIAARLAGDPRRAG